MKEDLASHPQSAGTEGTMSSESGICGICWMTFENCTCPWQMLKQRAYALEVAALTYKHRARERRRNG
jgi:hypothetical protein